MPLTTKEALRELERLGVPPMRGAQEEITTTPDQFLTGDTGGDSGRSAVGRPLYDPVTLQFIGVLFQSPAHAGLSGATYFVDENGRFIGEFNGGDFLVTFGGQANEGVTLDAQGNVTDTIPLTRFLPSSSGTGQRGTTFGEQLQLLEKQQQFQLEQQQAQQQFQTGERQESQLFSAAESAKARENQQRLSLQSEINSLIGQAVDIRQRSRDLLAQTLGDDPFRASAQLSGTAQRGTTPTQAFRNQLRPSARFEAPTVDFDASTSALQGQAGELRDFVTQGLPIPQSAFGAPTGFARGGVIDMKKGTSGKFGMAGESILVGEAGPEVITFNNDKMTVTPLRGRAQFGGEFSFGNTAAPNLFRAQTESSPTSAIQALSPLLESVGFENAPIFRRQGELGTLFQEGLRGQPLGTGAETLQRLGTTRPRLVRNSTTGGFFLVGRDGTLQRFTSLDQIRNLEFDPQQFVNMTSASMQQLGLVDRGQFVSDDLPLIEAGAGERGVGEPLGGPILVPLDDPTDPTRFAALPDPASNIRAFNRQPLSTQRLLDSAFILAGFGEGNAEERRRFFTPSGTARAGTTLGLG